MNQLVRLTIVVAVLVAAAPASAIEPEEAREISAIRHRCFLECVWGDDYCTSLGGQDCVAKRETCTKACTAEDTMTAARSWKVPEGWGTTKEQAIEVCLPEGERYFIADLRCADGSVPTYARTGSVGSRNPMPADMGFDMSQMDPTVPVPEGQPDTHTIDLYAVQCPDGAHELYFDMYHCGRPKPWIAPEGFTRPTRD